jgi:dTDP-4-dehydrorhamnose reductase
LNNTPPELRILLIGKNGQLGWELQRTLACLGKLHTLDFPEIDLSKPEEIRAPLRALAPAVIVNAAAYTAVDRAEQEADLAQAVNAQAPQVLAEEARRLGAALIHYSTDYVFDGTKATPYLETDPVQPLNVYGQSKLDGEEAVQNSGCRHWIFRTSWVYSLRRDSFVTKVLGWGRAQKILRVVSDQVGSPTWSRMLAEVTALALGQGLGRLPAWFEETTGLYHLAGDGQASRLEFARAILELDPRRGEQTVSELQPALTSDFPTPARRPLFSALDCTRFKRTFGLSLTPWQAALALALDQNGS